MQDNLKDLYNSLTADGKVDGSEQEFREIFSNAENLKQLHGALTADGEDYGTEDEFVNMFLPSSTPTQQVNEYAKTIQVPKQKATPKKQGIITKSIYGDQYIKNQQEGYKPQPKAVPSSLYAPESNNKTVLMQNLDAQQNAFNYQQQNTPLAKSIQQQKTKDKPAYTNVPASLSRTVGDEQKIVKDAVKKNVDAAVAAGSKNAISDAVKATYEELAQQGFDVNTINESGVVGEGVYNAVAPSAEAAVMQGGSDIFKGVFDKAKADALEAMNKEYQKNYDNPYVDNELSMGAAVNFLEAKRKYNEQLEPDKVLKTLNEAIDKEGLKSTFEQTMQQAVKYGIDPKEYFKTYVAPGLRDRVSQLLDYYMMKEYMPKNDLDYIMSGVSDSMLGMFTDWYTKSAKQNAYKQQALADYKASTGTEIARRAVGLISSAPEFMVSGGFASAVTKKICGRAITDMVARGFTEAQARNILTAQLASKFGQRLAVSMVHSAVSGGVNFGTLGAMSETMRGIRDDDFSVGKVFDKTIQETGKGIIFGGITGSYSAATAELTGAKKIISNLLGVPVNGLGLTASENTINLITGAETEDKPFFEQWAENSLTDLMMRATSHHNVSVLTSKGRRELGARIRSTFSGMSDSQKQLGANWRAHGFSEEAEAQLKNITGCDNLRDVLEYGVPKATDMPSLPYQSGEVKAKSQSVDDILKAEARKVREQNWDNLMNNRDLPAEVKQQLAAVMNAEYIPNPTVTQTTVTDSQGRKYVEYRDAGGNLNKRVPLADADMSMDAQEKIKNTNAISKMYSLGVSGKAVLAANAMRYASRPDAEGNIPTEEQQVQRQKNFLDRFFKKDLTDMELTELNMDLDKATIMFGGADKIKVITHTDGTASVQYSKNGIPVRTDHYATAEEANKKAYDDKFAQDMSLINALEDPEAVQKYYETQKGMQPGTLAEAVKGYDPADIDRISEQMLQTRDRVDIVTSGDGRARTTEQEELLQQYINWLKEQQKQFEQQPNEFSLTMNAAEQPQYTENYDKQDNHQINLTENDAVADDGKTKQTFNADAEKYKLNEADPQQMQGTEAAMPTEQTPQTKPAGAIEAESQRTQSEGTMEVEQPTPVPDGIDASTPHGSAYINGKNAVDGNNLPVMYQLNEDYELAKHRMAKFVPSNCPILDDILTMCQTGKFAEAQDLISTTDLPVEQKDALNKFVIAEATQSGMQDAMSAKIKAQQDQAAASIQAKADEQGNVTIVTLDNSSKKAHIVKGDVNNLNGTVMIRELDANENPVGDPYQISVKKIKSVSDTQRASEMAFNERKRIQQELDAYYAQTLNDVSFQPGKKVALKFEGMTIEATVVSENTDGTVTFQTEDGETITPRRDEAMQMLSDAKQEGYAIALQYEADAYAKARKEAEEARKQAEEAEAKRIAAEQAAAAERERLKDPVNRLKRDEAGKLDLTNSNPDDVSEFLAKHGAGGKKAAEQELAKVVKAIEELDNEQADTEGLTGVDALLAADEQATEKNARKAELERQQAFWADQINRIDKREEAVRKEEERKAAEKLKAEQKKQRSLAAFNKPINDARKRMADDPDAMDILDENNREPRTLEEAVADLIPQKGLVLKNWIDGSGVERLGLEGELGMNSSDLKKLTPFIGKVENGATDITTLSERIYENLPESIKNLAPDGNRDVRDAIIKILSEAQTADDIIHFVDNARIREAEAIYSANAAAAEEYERAKAEHTKQVEDETAPTYTAAEDPFAGSTGDAPFSFTGIKTPEDVNRHNERARKQGGLILNEESIKLERRTANLLDTIGRQLGRTIEVDPSLMQLGANGQASADGKTLFLSPKVVARGDQMVRFITGHELTHLIKKGDKDIQGVWNDFKKTVQDAMGDEFARIYDEKAKLYKDRIAEIREQSRKTLEDPNASEEAKAEARKYANLRNLSKEQIEEEVICDFIGDKVLTDEEFVKNMIERVEASNADSASICQRMRNFIDKILTYLKSLKNPTLSERRAQAALERAKDIWADMYELSAAKQRENLDMDLKMKTTSGNTVEIENDGTAKFSLETENDPENKRLIQAVANTYRAKWAKEDMQKVLDDTDKVMQDVLPLLDIHPDFNMTQQRTVALNSKGEPIYNVIFQNHDTEAPTIEFSTNCVKKESMNMLLDALRDAGQLGKLNEINLDIVLEVLKKHGYNIPCKMCYVESKRNILHLKKELANKWNSIAEAIKLDKNANILDDINVDLDESRKAKLNKIIKKRGSATIEGRIAKMMLDYPELRGRLRYEDIITPDGYEAILGKFSETPIMGLLSGYAGAASAKPTFGTHPFDQKMFNAKYNMMLPYFGENGMKYGGFRSRSFSDADPNLFVDEVQIRRNLVLTKSGMFGYTKVPYEVDMFGETGEFINMSLVVDVNGEGRAEGEGVKAHQANADLKRYAGLIKVGDPRHQQGLGMTDAEYEAYKAECGLKDGDMDYYFSQESFPVKKAIDFRKEERFGGRVGTVVVGVSDEMIRKALADDRIDMVIPYHRSLKTVASAEATNYYLATDYSAVQETKGNKGIKTSDSYLPSLQIYAPTYLNGNGEVDFNFNEACQTLGNAKVAAEAYKEWCSVNRFTPKFSDFKDDPNYYKLLIDFRRFDNEGNPLVQGALQMKLPNDWATRLDGYLTEREQTMAGNNEMLNNKALMKDVYKVLGIKKSFALPEKEEQMPIWGTSAKNAARTSEDKGINNSVDDKEFLHNSIKDGKNSPELSSRSSKADLNESTTPATNEEEAREEAQTDSFSFVEDPELLDKLNKEKTVPVYRAMQLIDGKLYPPMAAAVDGKMVNPIELGRWEQSDERPDLAVPDIDPKTGKQKTYKDGTPAYKFKLDKGTKDDSGEAQSTIPAGYNPYIHTSRSPLNDQFSSAWKRGHLVTVKVEVPESELTSGYRAEKSKDAVGEVEWKSGGVSGKLAKTGNPRRVILSRYDKPVEIVPTEEVAKSIAKMLEGTDIEIPFNVVNSELREALVKEGVKIGEPEKGSAGKAAIPAYQEWLAEKESATENLDGMASEPRMDVETERILSPVTEVDVPSNIGLNNGTLSAEGNARMELYSNMELADAREDIRSVAKIFNGKIGNASAGAFNYEKEGSEDTIHSVADAKKAGQIGRAMTIALEDYKNRLQEVGSKYEGVRKKVFDDAIADVDKAIKWYTEFANGEHQKIGEHADDGIKFSFTIPQNEEEYKKKETAWHTVMKETVAARHAQAPDQSENAKPLSAAKVQKIENITKSLDGIIASVNKKSIERDDFLNWISGAIGFRNGEKDKSKYGTAITLGNGDEVYMRVSNHSGRMINFELYRQNDKDSYGIVVNSSVNELDGYRPRFKDKKNVDHLELQYYTERFDDTTENQRQALEVGIAEGLKHLISTGSFEKMPLPNDVNPSGIYKRIFNEVKKRIEQENEINFSFEDLEQDKNLAGVHNLTLGKLTKAIRKGGLANPSVAIVDREKHAHDEFGDVSLILPSNLIDSRTGRNAGTWTHDVWTPTYPKSRTVFTSEGRKSFVNMLNDSGIDEGIRGKLMDEIDQMQFGAQPNLAYLYLKSRGIDATEYKHPDLTSDWVDIFRKHKTADKLLEAMKADENLTKKVNGATQHYFEVKFATEHRDQYIVAERNGEPGALIKAFRANRENMRKTYGVVDGKFSDEQVKEAFDAYKKKFRSKKHGVDDYWSVQNAYYDVYNRGWFEDYENWLDKTLNEHGVKTELHAGVDRNGNSKYVPDTVQNASRIMNESQKQTGGGSFGGWGTFIAQMAKHMKTLSDIRERKSMLGNEDNNEDVKYVRENFSQFPTMLNEKNPDLDLWDGSASKAFADLLKHIGKVQEYAKRKYGIDLSEDEVEDIKEYYKAFKRMPIDYFETKFDRPVSLNEFVSAVVPKNAPSDIVEALEKSGLQVFKYNPKKEGDREKVSRKAMSDDRVSFSFEEEQQKSPEFKAWFGDWENDPENASKVVDEEGKPLIVYHGAQHMEMYFKDGHPYTRNTEPFTVFKEGKGFFTDDKDAAKTFARGQKGLYACYLDIKKPFIFDCKGMDWDMLEGYDNSDNYKYVTTDYIVKDIKTNHPEYDGIIFKNVANENSGAIKHAIDDYIPLKPNQIKSATENNGEFSKENDDIRFSFDVPEGKTKQQMQAETDADIARQMNTVREGDTLSDVVRKATAIRESDKLVKLHQTISDNLIKSGDNFEDVLRKAEALKAASAEVDSFAFSREERAHRAYEREKKRQEKAINDAQKALRKKVVDEINFLMNDKHLTVFNKSALSKMLKDVQNADTNNIQEILTSVRTEVDKLTDKSQQRQIEDLMKLKTQDQNGKGMSIAKNVSDSVRRTLDMIRGRIVDLKATGYEEDMTQLRRQNIFINGENKRLENQIYRLKHEDPTDERTQQQIDAEIAEAEAKIAENLQKKEANLSELAELKVKKQEAETAKALKADADVTEEINDLMKKMNDHVAGNATWTLSDSEKLTGLQILKMKQDADTTRRDISKLQSQLAELEESLASHRREARRPQRYVPVQRMEQLEQQIAGMKAAIEQATKNLIGQNGSIIDIIKNMIEEGKDSLLNQVENEKNRKFELLHGMLGDIQGKKRIPTNIKEREETHSESKIKKLFAAQLHSFEYLAKRINENTLGEDGWFYNYFVKGKNGVMQAESNHQQGLREAVATLDEKAQEIYGKKFADAANESATVENHPGVFLQHEQNGMIIEEEIPLSRSQAMYLYMVWKMPDGKMKLQLQGFTDETMGQIREFLDEKDVNYADWIQDEFLKDQRAKYNDLYVELYHTSMANIDNYVPLKIAKDNVKKDSNLSEDKANRKSLEERAGSLINRRFNTHEVNWTMGAFDVIAEHVNQMEEWHAFARVRKDLDYILSNTYVRNQLDANSAGRFNQLYDAAAIAVHAYTPDKAKFMDDTIGWLTKGIVGGNIAYRQTTAMKQVLSVPAFYGYSNDPRYLIALTKNIGYQYTRNSPAVIANMITAGFSGKNAFKLADAGKRKSLLSDNIMWCLKNVPSFRNRVLKGTSGLNYMDEKMKGKIGQWIDKYLDYGMATNQMIDAITCSIGIKSIYDYKYGKLAKAIEADTSLSPEEKEQQLEEARRAAIMDADIYYNATQQSNHAAFMAPMQLSRSVIDRSLSVYQNASIGYSRRAASSAQDLLKMDTPAKWNKLQKEYAIKFMNENPDLDYDEAMSMANKHLKEQAMHHAVGVALYGFGLNWLWDWGGRGLLGFTLAGAGLWGLFGNSDDDKEKRIREEAGLEDNVALKVSDAATKIAEWSSYPLRGLTGMNMTSQVINGTFKHPLLFWDEIENQQKTAKKYWTEQDYTAIAAQAFFKGLRVAGFDARVWHNIVLGTVGLGYAAGSGNADSDAMLMLMLYLNTPNSNRRQVAENMYKDYDRDTYVRNIMNAAKYTDNKYLALLPGMKLLTTKNQLDIYKEFEFNHLSDEEFKQLKSVQKEMIKHLKSMDELQKAYDEESDPITKNAIGRKLIQVMKAEQPKTASTADELAKKAKENLLVKDVKNTSYISQCNSNDLIEDEMLKELKAEYKPVMNNFDELKYDSPSAAEEYAKQNEADITKYKELDKYMTKIAQLKGKMEKMKNSDTLQILMDTIRSVRNQALGKKKQ